MSDLPHDIIETARKLVQDWEANGVSPVDVARAILAERERCASICRQATHPKNTAGAIVASNIERAILTPPTP